MSINKRCALFVFVYFLLPIRNPFTLIFPLTVVLVIPTIVTIVVPISPLLMFYRFIVLVFIPPVILVLNVRVCGFLPLFFNPILIIRILLPMRREKMKIKSLKRQ